ncbi:MAG: hypothetical protein J5I98_36865 [Phaeodactylibacter sp.]|nr:hypothetical protein [Phaeodactylibacter sp.]
MKQALLIGCLAVLIAAAAFFFSRQESSGPPDKLALSYDICLAAGSGYHPVTHDSLLRQEYIRRFWADSSRQFFSKTLAGPEGDTLFLSVFNNANLKTAQEMLLSAGFEPLRRERAEAGGTAALKMLARSPDGTFFLRYLIDAGRFSTVTMADQPGKDSSRLRQQFETESFIQKIEKCL